MWRNIHIRLGGEVLAPLTFEKWTYPPGYEPLRFQGPLATADGEVVKFRALGGLANEPGSIAGESEVRQCREPGCSY